MARALPAWGCHGPPLLGLCRPWAPASAKKARTRLSPHFLPYDGLRIASDKVLGELFWE